MELTREQAITEHRKMWNWIADEIERLKTVCNINILKFDYLTESKFKNEAILSWCFLCEYSYKNKDNKDNICELCPVISSIKGIGCLNGLYSLVCRSENWQEQAKFARQIANLPERNN